MLDIDWYFAGFRSNIYIEMTLPWRLLQASGDDKVPIYAGKEDLRSRKTERALNSAMTDLLESRNFGKVTVSDICERALISRATFYAHFIDKYDLLKSWLANLGEEDVSIDSTYEHMENIINTFVDKKRTVINNVVRNADGETIGVLFEAMLSTLNLSENDGLDAPKYVVISNFYAGGMLYYLLWHVNNKFPANVAPMNVYLFEMIHMFKRWKPQ